MTLQCPCCGAELALRLAALEPAGVLADTAILPQLTANGASNGLAANVQDTANLPQVTTNGHLEEEKVLGSKPSTKRRRFNYSNPLFLKFWGTYPRRIGKASAYRRWVEATREVDPEVIIAGAAAFAERCRGKDPQYIPYPEGWLHAGRWEDEEAATPAGPAYYAPVDTEARMAELEQLSKEWDDE